VNYLKAIIARAGEEPVGAKCALAKYLPVWKRTCGGETFMGLGMLTYLEKYSQERRNVVRSELWMRSKQLRWTNCCRRR
jgi:hypothetical protein